VSGARLHRCRSDRPRSRALRLAAPARALNDIVGALGAFDTQLYLAVAAQRNVATSVIAVALTYLNWNGFFWWVLALLLLRSRVLTRRGLAALARVVVGVHYPFDVLGGMTIGVISGVAAPRAIALLRRRLRWRAFVIPHTHWDREWYERFEGYRARLVPMVSRLLDILERDGDFRSFTFDGPTIAIQDHLEKVPKDRPRVEALVSAERLLIGPWHVLADLLSVSGE